MKNWILRRATPFTAVLSLMIGVSGVMLFYRLQSPLIKPMHEWIGLATVAVMLLHVWKNWMPMVSYFRRGALIAPLALALAVGGGFLYVAANKPANADPTRAILRGMARAPLTAVAAIAQREPEELAQKLRDKGFKVDALGQSLGEISEASGKSEKEALVAVSDLFRKSKM